MKNKVKPPAKVVQQRQVKKQPLPDYRLVLDQHNRAFRKIGSHYHLVAHICFAKSYDDWIASGGEEA